MSVARKLSSAPPAALSLDDPPSPASGKIVPLRPQGQAAMAGRLAATVERMRDLEDDISTILSEADGALHVLETDGTLRAAGFRTPAEFEERVSGSMTALHAMRAQSPARKVRTKKRSSKRRPDAEIDRARKTRALESISQTLHRLRELDGQIRRKIDAVRAVLAEIDTERLYEECGYTTYEEFLDRAVGASPVLSASTNALGDGPLAPPEELPPPTPDLRPSMPFADRPSAFTELPSSSDDDPIPRVVETASSSQELPAIPIRRGPMMVVTIVMTTACAILGGAAGFWTNREPPPTAGPEATASAQIAPPCACASTTDRPASAKTATVQSHEAEPLARQSIP